jgi:hypothetical protein
MQIDNVFSLSHAYIHMDYDFKADMLSNNHLI